MAWHAAAALLVAVIAVAAAVPAPVQELPAAAWEGAALKVPASDGSLRAWTVRMEPAEGPAEEGFAAGLAMMQGVRGSLRAVHDPGADIVVAWVPELEGRVGQHVTGTPRVEVALGDSRCGAWRPYDAPTLARVVAHEIGHALGLPHGPPSSIMSPHLPVGYIEPCLIGQGGLLLEPRQTTSVPVTLAWPRTLSYTVASDAAVDVCIAPAQAQGMTGWACREGSRHAAGEAALGSGEYHLRVRCDAWWGSCGATYTLSKR